MKAIINENDSKHDVFKKIINEIIDQGFFLSEVNSSKPWGGYITLVNSDTERFHSIFFPELSYPSNQKNKKHTPKVLIIEKTKRLSWQYHNHRAESWKIIQGPISFSISPTDEEKDLQTAQTGELIQIDQLVRHRLIGSHSWGVVAEIWTHTDVNKDSTEDDIIRLQDDFGRGNI